MKRIKKKNICDICKRKLDDRVFEELNEAVEIVIDFIEINWDDMNRLHKDEKKIYIKLLNKPANKLKRLAKKII